MLAKVVFAAILTLAIALLDPAPAGADESAPVNSRALADKSDSPYQTQRVTYDYSALYDQLSPSIVTVEADAGNGSGFIVDEIGLIATSHHVVASTRFLSVQFHDGRRVEAEIVTLDPRADLALLKVHENHVQGLTPLKFIPPSKRENIKTGIPVLAFGSPLSLTFLATQGIIARVNDDTLLGDYLIESGSSGGPLVTLDGNVIGINTFGIRGIAGAVRVHLLRDILKDIDRDRIKKIMMPSNDLRTVSTEKYPIELLKVKIFQGGIKLNSYNHMQGNFVMRVVTPVVLGVSAIHEDLRQASNRYKRRGRRIHDPTYSAIDETFYSWQRNVTGALDLVVSVLVEPQISETWGSVVRSGIGAGFGVNSLPSSYKFKGEFYRLHVYRDGEMIEPIRRGRILDERFVQSPLIRLVDEAYAGKYLYDPREFLYGSSFRFDVYDATNPDKPHHSRVFKANSDLIRYIRSDFREAIDENSEYWKLEYASQTKPPGTGVVVIKGDELGIVHRNSKDAVELIEIFPGSAAYEAGLRTGDSITKIEGRSVMAWLDQNVGESRDFLRVLNKLSRGRISSLEATVMHRFEPREIRFVTEDAGK